MRGAPRCPLFPAPTCIRSLKIHSNELLHTVWSGVWKPVDQKVSNMTMTQHLAEDAGIKRRPRRKWNKYPSKRHFRRKKYPVWANRTPTVTNMSTLCNRDEQKSITERRKWWVSRRTGYKSRRPLRVSTGIWGHSGYRLTETGQVKTQNAYAFDSIPFKPLTYLRWEVENRNAKELNVINKRTELNWILLLHISSVSI